MNEISLNLSFQNSEEIINEIFTECFQQKRPIFKLVFFRKALLSLPNGSNGSIKHFCFVFDDKEVWETSK